MKIYFVSNNEHKIREAKELLQNSGFEVCATEKKIEEIQTEKSEELVRDKVLKAYKLIGRPLFVEHTRLYIKGLSGLPGGLTQIFWDTLKADRFGELFGGKGDASNVTAKTTVGYCDGRSIRQFEGKIDGEIVSKPRGSREFQWDCVFQPIGYTETFAEMGERKNKISMRRLALEEFSTFLRNEGQQL